VLNANSLAKLHAKEQLLVDLQSYQIDVAIISETIFKKHHKPQFSDMPGYRTHRRYRVGRGGGGVAIFVNNSYVSKACSVSNDRMDLELLWVLVQSGVASTIIGALYHPPTFCYPLLDLYNFIEATLEELMTQYPASTVILAGDFNQLNVAEVTARMSLVPLVNTPTRGSKRLDMIMTSWPQLHRVKVITSAVRSDHKAILASSHGGIRDRTKSSQTKQFRRRTLGQHTDPLHLRDLDLDQMVVEEPEAAWLEFYAIITSWLRRRNRLMRRQKIEEADALSLRIGKEIAKFNSRELCSLNTEGGTKKLWVAVRRIAGGEERKDELNINAEDLNSHYAAISTDPMYQQPTRKLTACSDIQLLGEPVIFGIY